MINNDKSAAYHESGHAVTAYRFGHDGDSITIIPKDGITGSCLSEGPWGDRSTDIEQIIVLYAGYAAEHKYNMNADRRGSSNDDEKAAALLRGHNEAESQLRVRAEDIVEENWAIIETIANELFDKKTLLYDEWTIIVDSFDEGGDWKDNLRQMRGRLVQLD